MASFTMIHFSNFRELRINYRDILQVTDDPSFEMGSPREYNATHTHVILAGFCSVKKPRVNHVRSESNDKIQVSNK